MEQHHNSLQSGFRLHWYLIKEILGQGGFGITYLAEDTNLNQLVAIKEYLPVDMAVRGNDASIQPVSEGHGEQYTWGLDRFMTEAQTLARFKHPNIVRVLAVFPENNTAYMVMEYEYGRGLHDILKEKKTLIEDELNTIVLPILDGLEAVHAANFIHRDIKPPNIYIRDDGSPVLLDFGSARQSFSEHTRTLTTMVSPGYAPFEQYVGKSDKQGPWTDIYGLGATMYRAVTGIAPSGSMDRSEAILHTEKDIYVSVFEIAKGKYSNQFLHAIDHALAFKPEDRPQSIAEWRKDFGGVYLDATGPKDIPVGEVANNFTESEEETIPITSKQNKHEPESKPSTKIGFLDKLYLLVKKLLKWGAILLVVLIVIGILTNGEKKAKEEQPKITDEKHHEESVPVIETEEDITPEIQPIDPGDEQEEKIKALLSGAEQNIKELRLTTPAGNNAIEKYHNVLALDPNNTDALNGIDRVVDEYIELMDRALIEDNLPAAQKYFNKGSRVNPDHNGLPAARQRLGDAMEKNRARVDMSDQESVSPIEGEPEASVKGEESLVPESERQEIRKLREQILQNPGDKKAREKMQKLAKKVEGKIKKAIRNEDYDLAEDYVSEILQYAKKDSKRSKELNDLLQRIQIKKIESAN